MKKRENFGKGFAGSFFVMIIFIIGILIILIFNYAHSFKIEYRIVRYLNSENYVMEKLIWLNARPSVQDYNEAHGLGATKTVRASMDLDDMIGIYEYLAELKQNGQDISDVVSDYGKMSIDNYDYLKTDVELIGKITATPIGLTGVGGILADYFLNDISKGSIAWDCSTSSSSSGVAFYIGNYNGGENDYHLRAPQSLSDCITYAEKNPLPTSSDVFKSFVVTTTTYLPIFKSVDGQILEKAVFYFKTKAILGKVINK